MRQSTTVLSLIPLFDVIHHERESGVLAGTGRLFHWDGQCRELPSDLKRRNKMQSRRENRRFQDRMFRTVESENITDSTDMHDLRRKTCSDC